MSAGALVVISNREMARDVGRGSSSDCVKVTARSTTGSPRSRTVYSHSHTQYSKLTVAEAVEESLLSGSRLRVRRCSEGCAASCSVVPVMPAWTSSWVWISVRRAAREWPAEARARARTRARQAGCLCSHPLSGGPEAVGQRRAEVMKLGVDAAGEIAGGWWKPAWRPGR